MPPESIFVYTTPSLAESGCEVHYGNGRREIALLGIDPIWRNLLNEFLKAQGHTGMFFSDRMEIEDWLKGEGADCPLLLAEADQEGRMPGWIKEIKAALPPYVKVLPLPGPRDSSRRVTADKPVDPSYRPSELFRYLECALAAVESAGVRR